MSFENKEYWHLECAEIKSKRFYKMVSVLAYFISAALVLLWGVIEFFMFQLGMFDNVNGFGLYMQFSILTYSAIGSVSLCRYLFL